MDNILISHDNKTKNDEELINIKKKQNSEQLIDKTTKRLFELVNFHLKDPEPIIKKFGLNEENLKKLKDLSKYFSFFPKHSK